MFEFSLNTRVTFGPGCRTDLAGSLVRRGWSRAGVVVDHALLQVPLVQAFLEELRDSLDELVVGECSIREPTYDALDAARGQFADGELRAIIGIGGGSALDMAKAMAVLVHNSEPAIHYRGFDRMTEPVLPIIAVPTTAGTGSEVTPNASFIDSHEKRKMGINGEAVRPCLSYLDPELTLSCPVGPTVSAAVDSLVHATEAYVARKTNRMARMFAREGFGIVFNNIERVVEAPDDLEARTEVMYGAFLAGVALMHSGTGPAAAMSYPLGVHFGVPHGLGGGLFLPHVARHNARGGYEAYADLYRTMDGAEPDGTRQEQAERFADRVEELWERIGVPATLGFSGMTAEFADRFTAETLQLAGALEQNPVPFGEPEIRETLRVLSV